MLSQKKGKNGVYTHSFSWDSPAASNDINVIRCSIERSAQAPQLGGAARGPLVLLGVLHFHFPIWKVTPLGKNMGQDRYLHVP